MKYPSFFLLLSLISSLTPAVAEPEKGIYVFPQAAIADYSIISELEADPLIGIGVGFRFMGPFAVELDYLIGDSTPERLVRRGQPDLTGSIDVDIWNIRSLVYFLESDRLHPFASLGVGIQDIDLPDVGSESQVNAGLGLRWNILDNLDARASFNFYDGQEFGDLKRSLNLGLHYQFGRTLAQQVVRTEPVDSDNDGVIDSQDVCLGSRAGAEVDVRGCARPADTDADGVPDVTDQCPRTFDRSRKVDAVGCYQQETVVVPKKIEKTFYFDFDSSVIQAAHEAKAREIAAFLKDGTQSTIELSGHADSIGSSEYNQTLSMDRARKIAELLTQKTGIKAAVISTRAFGETMPELEGEGANVRAKNRRVQATVRTKKRELR
jgi:OOP family OmpA-OmpF porin